MIQDRSLDWLFDAETYISYNTPNIWDTIAQTKVTFVTHCPINAELIERFHTWGIRCFPYVSFSVGAKQVVYSDGTPSDEYEGVNFGKQTNFFVINKDGEPVDDPLRNIRAQSGMLIGTGDGVGNSLDDSKLTCPNTEEYQEKMLKWVEMIMQMGADGVYIDNVLDRVKRDPSRNDYPCYASDLQTTPPQYQHKHIIASKANMATSEEENEAYTLLLRRARKIVKCYKPDGAILGNTSYDPLGYIKIWDHLDASSFESYIVGPVSKCIFKRQTDGNPYSWTDWFNVCNNLTAYIAQKAVLALSNVGDSNCDPNCHSTYGNSNILEDAFFCYASARLSGLCWNGGGNLPLYAPPAAVFYRIQLGKPLTGILQENGIYYRIFLRGLVAVNPTEMPQIINTATLNFKTTNPSNQFVDLFQSSGCIPVVTQALIIPAQSGRVFLFS